MTKKKFIFIGLLVLIYSVYFNSLKSPLCFDAWTIILNNPYIRDWTYFSKLFTKDYFYYFSDISYRPVTSFSYFIDYTFSEYNPVGWHIFTLFTHYLVVILIYLVISKITENNFIALFTSVIFAIHPVNNEVINEPSSREDIQVLALMLFSFYCYIKYREKTVSYSAIDKNTLSNRWLYLSLLSYFFALFTKESALMLPFILFLCEHTFNKFGELNGLKKGLSNSIPRNIYNYIKTYIPFFLLIIFYFYITTFVIYSPAALVSGKIGRGAFYPGGNIFVALSTTIETIVFYYFPKLVYPVSLSPGAGYDITDFGVRFYISVIVLIFIFVLIIFIKNKQKIIFFGLIYFFLNLIPVANIIPIGATSSERYLYIPSVGFFLIFGTIMNNIFFVKREKLENKFRITGVFLCAILFIVYVHRTLIRNSYWNNPEKLCLQVLKVTPDDYIGYKNAGDYYFYSKEYDKALIYYKKSQDMLKIKIKSLDYYDANYHDWYPSLIYRTGLVYWSKREEETAIKYFGYFTRYATKRLKVKNYRVYFYLGDYYFRKGDLDKSMSYFQEALKIVPGCSYSLQNLGLIEMMKKNFDLSLYHLNKAITLNKKIFEAYNNIAIIYLARGDYARAMYMLNTAIKFNSKAADVYYNLALLNKILGNKNRAEDIMETYFKLTGFKSPEIFSGDSIINRSEYSKLVDKILTRPKGIFASVSG